MGGGSRTCKISCNLPLQISFGNFFFEVDISVFCRHFLQVFVWVFLTALSAARNPLIETGFKKVFT